MKKYIALLLAAALAFALTVPACAGHTATKAESAQILYNLGLFKGNGDNPDGTPTFELERAPTRAEAVIILLRLLGQEQAALASSYETPYTDVPDWAAPYIGYAYHNGLAFGIHSTTFGCENPITSAQFLTYLLRALGYQDGVDFYWETAWTLTDQLGITHGEYGQNAGTFLRGDAALTAVNALFTEKKGRTKTLLDQLTDAGAVVLWNCAPLQLSRTGASFLFYPVQGESFASFKVTKVTVNGKRCDTMQLTSPEAVSTYLTAAGYDRTGFCFLSVSYDNNTAAAYTAPNGNVYPQLTFTVRYTGTLANGSTVSGQFTQSYYLDGN